MNNDLDHIKRAQEILDRTQSKIASTPSEPNPDTVVFAVTSAQFLNSIEHRLANVDESTRRYIASRIHPEGTVEDRHLSRSPLTNLPDKKPFLDLLPTFEKNRRYSVIIMDGNGLKLINDKLGHDYGDAFLIAIAQSIKATSSEFGNVASNIFHLSGDEFAAFVPKALAEAFIGQVKINLDEYLLQAKIPNGRNNNSSVSSEPIRNILGGKPGISAGYGASEKTAERTLQQNKSRYYELNRTTTNARQENLRRSFSY